MLRRGFVDDERTVQMREDGWLNLSVVPKEHDKKEVFSPMSSWLLYVLLSALSAAFVSIFGKMGLEGLDSSAATAVRGVIMAIFLVTVMIVQGHVSHLPEVFADRRALACVALSGIAGATSWRFYFMALKTGDVSRVAPIDKLSVVFAVLLAILIFEEEVTLSHGIGIFLIAIGSLMIAIL